MPVPSISLLLGLVLLAYLSTFVIFAVVRVLTGVSIQRVGYSGFRRLAFSPRHGIRVTVRGVGLSPHRPTFALPTWCSLVITELRVTVDLEELDKSAVGVTRKHAHANGSTSLANGNIGKSRALDGTEDENDDDGAHGKLWERLNEIKEQVKRLHGQIEWLRLIDLVTNTVELCVVGVGSVRVERANVSVDTRSQTVDRSRLFQHSKAKGEVQQPAEWKCLVRSILFTAEGRKSTEILDYATLSVHGLLHRELQGLRDASVALKLGRVNIPFDDIEYAQQRAVYLRGLRIPHHAAAVRERKVASGESTGAEPHDSPEERIVRAISDSRAFIASILRGMQEVQLAVGFFGLSKRLSTQSHFDRSIYFNLAMKEVGLDILRLDSRTPAHRMYFARNDVAHQGLLTAIAISAGIDDGHKHPERMLYVPMITATVKTTLPSRAIHLSSHDSAGDRNTNVLYANLVCTSPSIDLDPHHLPLVLAMLKGRDVPTSRPKQEKSADHHHIISRLLPKASIKISIQEPVIRVSLPPMDTTRASEDDFDLLISTTSSMALELESSHSQHGQMHYGFAVNYRHTSHELYYQTSASERHDLMRTDTCELKVDVNAIPDATVTAFARVQTCTGYLVRPDICEGIRQINRQVSSSILTESNHHASSLKTSFLRKVPSWLEHFRIEGNDFAVQVAGVDKIVSHDTRGFSLELESWSSEYRAHREDNLQIEHRRRVSARLPSGPDKTPDSPSRSSSPRRAKESFADGRRLTVHLHNLEGLIIDSIDDDATDSFLSVPRFEVAFSTSTDATGPVFHINSHAKSILLAYSLYRHYAIGVAVMVVKRTFYDDRHTVSKPQATMARPSALQVPGSTNAAEITTIDCRIGLLQVKATMPSDPRMMLQIFGFEAGRHRWASPFMRCPLARLYVRAPSTKAAWSRIIGVKALRIDLRDIKRKHGSTIVTEKTVDLAVETIRIGVPHQLVVHDIFDNITNVVKTTKQMQHNFMTESRDYILTKEPEGPKHVPRVSFRAQLFVFDIEDSSFEWKLSTIYRAGLQEQKQRLAREDIFRLKEKRLTQCHRSGSRARAESARPGARTMSTTRRSNSFHRRRNSQPPSKVDRQRSGRGKMRYDADGQCGLTDTSHLSIDQARDKLNRLHAQSWKSRIDRVQSFQRRAVRDIRTAFWGSSELPEDYEQGEPIMAMSQRPSLLVIAMTDLALTIDKPSFPINEVHKFLHDVGKGMPTEMKYGLLIPVNLHVTTGEVRIQLRDYPLPMFHIPPLANGQPPRLPSMSMRTDFVIAEEFRDIESQREVDVQVVSKEKMGSNNGKPYAITVRRTISPVKTYSNMKFEINTSQPTKLTWGTSYQPAIQDTMQCIEGFTKPPIDTSDRVGFWDKIRLSFHSRINVAWKGDGDLHLVLKGSRDPYVVTGQGAGLAMVWRNDVRWNIAQHNDPRQFMTIDSGDYILAVPDFNNYARHDEDLAREDSISASSSSSYKREAIFKKVIMKLSGKVRWLAGLTFERDLPGGGRSFDFKPHYEVVLKHPDFAKAPKNGQYDAYAGLRSNHIHLSLAVAAPHDRDWSVSNLKPSNDYNSVHLTPRFFSHFYSWWSMFSGVMSLPVRQGPLWGPTEKQSKKFGRHLATIKYNLLMSPLFISHIYKHKDAEEYNEDSVSATGLKMKLDSFMLDLHQRREYFDIKGHSDADTKRSSGMRINKAQLDFISADLRAVSASITGTSAQEIEKATDETLASLHSQMPQVDMSRFTIPDNDFTWIDMDDFVELDWILPAESDPETKILPLGYAPRFTYFRQTDHDDAISGDTTRTSPFGDEPTHYCVMSAKNDPRRVQAELIAERLATLRTQRSENDRAEGEQHLHTVQSMAKDAEHTNKELDALRAHGEHLKQKYRALHGMFDTLKHRLECDDPSTVPELETAEEFYEAHENAQTPGPGEPGMRRVDTAPLADYTNDSNNRFIVHNPQIKWNNSLRNIILRYIHQNSQRRGFVYFMSRRAVRFLLDILEEQKKKAAESRQAPQRQKSYATAQTPFSPDGDDEQTIQDRIDELLKDGRNFVDADEPDTESESRQEKTEGPSDEIATEFMALNTYHFRLIAPQIQLQSEKNPKSVVLVTAKGAQLRVVQIMDKDRVNDDISGLVQRRFTAAMDSLQMFVTSTKTFGSEYLRMYSGNKYGVKAGTCWPPWVPLEIMFEYEDNPFGFHRVVQRTSASLRYDKYNTLRLKYNDDVTGGETRTSSKEQEAESRMDHVWVEFPQFRAVCDSTQYFAMYIIVMDLLLYNEPLEKTRSERLEKIMLASDFSDLTGSPEMVQMLQERIRQLEEIKMHFQVHEKYLDRQGWKDRITMDQDLANCEDELFFMMKAITVAQQRIEDKRELDNGAGVLHINMSAKEIAWHLIQEKGESLIQVQLQNGSFDRTDNNDGSNYNCMEIGRINGFNLLPDALYPEIIGPYVDPGRGYKGLEDTKMFRVQWLMLEAIAGIPVVDSFEMNVVPLKLQVEREVAKKLFEYIFPGVGGNAFDGGGFSPFMVKNMIPPKEEDEQEPDSGTNTPLLNGDTPDVIRGTHNGTGAGSLERRLAPTLHLPKSREKKSEPKGLGITSTARQGLQGFNLFQHSNPSSTSVNGRSAASRQALAKTNDTASSPLARSPSERSIVTMRSEHHPNGDSATPTDRKRSRVLQRHGSTSNDKRKKSQDQSDDLTQMMNRASNYMTLSLVKIPSMVLCLSYKGKKGQRNIEDVHDLVFRMPMLEYRNKTWSNLDLALQLKKDVIRALIGHAGAIVGNKFSHHNPKKQQQSRLREIANMSSLLGRDNSSINASSDSNSLQVATRGETPGRPSTTSGTPSTFDLSESMGSTPSLSESEQGTEYADPVGFPPVSIQRQRPTTSDVNGRDAKPLPGAAERPGLGREFQARSRGSSISRHLTGFSQRLKQSDTRESREGSASADEGEEGKRKSRLLMGPKELLKTLRDQ
ncbi:hypothetical protein B0A48_01268 [Cryoendolithus antarcticus]|uniref:FMP27 GFWDK domain-containing protein n=1 Tax=Cryoendolithus antarcticus TaxID=1507870 RepID=A0A1V8TT98_9PEZI|nr:hypothetical protein B0A48_01268 [Cryoendolithus antarcticus]